MSTNFCRIWSRIGFRIKISQCIKPINFSSALEKYFRIYFSQLWEYQEQHQLPFLPNYIAWLIKTTVEFDRHHDHPHSQFNLGVIDAEACLFDKVDTLLRFHVGLRSPIFYRKERGRSKGATALDRRSCLSKIHGWCQCR